MHLRTTAAGFAFLTMTSIASAETLVVCTEASPDFLNPQFSTANTSFDVAAQRSLDRRVSSPWYGRFLVSAALIRPDFHPLAPGAAPRLFRRP
jgi:ABC-type transport system substrate-binding protein